MWKIIRIAKLDRISLRLQAFNNITNAGHWRQSDHGRWTAGIWMGALWFAHYATGEARWASEAAALTRRLGSRKHARSTHDMGFLFQPSFVRGSKITNDAYYRDVALATYAAPASRYHPVGRVIPAWDPADDP